MATPQPKQLSHRLVTVFSAAVYSATINSHRPSKPHSSHQLAACSAIPNRTRLNKSKSLPLAVFLAELRQLRPLHSQQAVASLVTCKARTNPPMVAHCLATLPLNSLLVVSSATVQTLQFHRPHKTRCLQIWVSRLLNSNNSSRNHSSLTSHHFLVLLVTTSPNTSLSSLAGLPWVKAKVAHLNRPQHQLPNLTGQTSETPPASTI